MEQKNSYLIFFPWKSIASFFTSSCVTIKVWTKLTRIEILSKHNKVKSSLKEQKNSYSILFPWNLLVPRKSTSIASSFIPISLSITNETQPPRKATRVKKFYRKRKITRLDLRRRRRRKNEIYSFHENQVSNRPVKLTFHENSAALVGEKSCPGTQLIKFHFEKDRNLCKHVNTR